ncbi:hypothetical protein NECAME_06857 [Necator americanus]|uniref:Uncharacterized protein n=1 Tax=Necator americanus TaxID=51031 RepID=W2TTW1_NECAM|nr:hypothetical protein NECAME_06857 [Necator americanus]ETN84536.1 hypothetical protein NECAME_06857 [Necator americanus]
MKAELEQECGEESYNSVVTMLRGYGCNISDEIVAWNTSTILHTTTTSYKIASATKTSSTTQKIYQATTLPPSSFSSSVVEGSGTTLDTEPSSPTPFIDDSSKKVHELLNLQNNFLATTAVNFGTTPAQGTVSVAGNDNGIGPGTLMEDKLSELSTSTEKEESVNEVEEDSPLFNYTVSSNCTSSMREHARVCTAPLMRTWAALRATWPHLAEVTFPVYKYSRVQLLELCDSYANVFLCANIDDIRVCLMDELVRFAQDHLGYICSPQNIQRFMGHYDCIMEQEALGKDNCRRKSKRLVKVGEEQGQQFSSYGIRTNGSPVTKQHCLKESPVMQWYVKDKRTARS